MSDDLREKSTKSLVNEICLSKDHNYLFSEIRENKNLRSVFFLHKLELFPENYGMRWFYLTNVNCTQQENAPKILKYIYDIIGVDSESRFGLLIRSDLFEFKEDFKELLLYFLIFFIRSNKNLLNLINSPSFNYKIMRENMNNKKDKIDDNVEIDKIIKGDLSGVDPIIISKIHKIKSRFESRAAEAKNFHEEPNWQESVKAKIPHHYSARNWLCDILKISNLKLDEYINILNILYLANLINNKNTLLWCENCFPDKKSFIEPHGRVSPSEIISSKCSLCSNCHSYSSILSLDDLLMKAIFSKDGFLAIYFGWILKQEKISFRSGLYSSKYENDFIINDHVLVECKMFKLNKDEQGIREELHQSLHQIEDHIKSLENDGNRIDCAYLIWNRSDSAKILLRKMEGDHNNLVIKYHFEVFGRDDIENLIIKLKKQNQ